MDEDCNDNESIEKSDKSDSEALIEMEKELNEMDERPHCENMPEKRKKPDERSEESGEDSFTMVQRRRPRKIIRSDSPILTLGNNNKKKHDD